MQRLPQRHNQSIITVIAKRDYKEPLYFSSTVHRDPSVQAQCLKVLTGSPLVIIS